MNQAEFLRIAQACADLRAFAIQAGAHDKEHAVAISMLTYHLRQAETQATALAAAAVPAPPPADETAEDQR